MRALFQWPFRSPSSVYYHCSLALLLLIQSTTQAQQQQHDDLDMSASEFFQQPTSATSHEIVTSGWPATSPMWPSIERDSSGAGGRAPASSSGQQFEPFIYADKPNELDYSLLLTINKTLAGEFKSRLKLPIKLELSFEYYFNHDDKVSGLPNIKLEIDRKETHYVIVGDAGRNKTRMWVKHSERVSIADWAWLDKHDWLKLSLVNRETPSLVALRRLKVSFSSESDASAPITPAKPQAELPPPTQQEASSTTTTTTTTLPPPPPTTASPATVRPPPPPPPPTPPVEQSPAAPDASDTPTDDEAADPMGATDEVAQASNVIQSTIKPVPPTRRGWSSMLGRRKRDVAERPEVPTSYLLTCFNSDDCDHWKVDNSQSQIQWSLARMPPSTNTVKMGYYYASNRANYGDARQMLRLVLNQTETATIADQNADHCIELALYVTERTHLKLYRLTHLTSNSSSMTQQQQQLIDGEWIRGNLLLTWAPTISSVAVEPLTTGSANASAISNESFLDRLQVSSRAHLAGAQLAASNQSGWTLETLCLGDFFHNVRECAQTAGSAPRCAFGFEMAELGATSGSGSGGKDETGSSDAQAQQEEQQVQVDADRAGAEQVVGVALLRQFALNIPNKQQAARPLRWLETWDRHEVQPDDNWRFYPKMDYAIRDDNVTLINLFDDAHYSIQSDWLHSGKSLNFDAHFLIELLEPEPEVSNLTLANSTTLTTEAPSPAQSGDPLFRLTVNRKLVDSNFEQIYALNSTIDWLPHYNNSTKLALFNMSLASLSDHLPTGSDSLFKVVIDLVLDCHRSSSSSSSTSEPEVGETQFRLTLANVSLADRCHPNPCQFGACQQNGTEPNDWQCTCDSSHRGRRCQFGRWCSLAHVAPPTIQQAGTSGGQQQKRQLLENSQLIVLKQASTPAAVVAQQQQQSGGTNKMNGAQHAGAAHARLIDLASRISGKEFCQRKLGAGSQCAELDRALDDQVYYDENITFTCSCQDDYYLSDDGKCKQAHQCNSIVCPHIGQVCDETKPFNRSQPCHCNEKLDWYPISRGDSSTSGNQQFSRCQRRQCHDKRRDCGFDAHICLPTLPGERPICKCGPKFVLKLVAGDKKVCQSSACNLPTLNDCTQLCLPNDTNLERPYTCACHEGYTLDPSDGRTCRASGTGSQKGPRCKPACDGRTQVCTEFGCKCRQGYVAEGEVIVQVTGSGGGAAKTTTNATTGNSLVDYVKSVRCLNVCSLSYAENKLEFERIEAVCPLGLCDPHTFNCRCSDPTSSLRVHSKYEPIWLNDTSTSGPEDAALPFPEMSGSGEEPEVTSTDTRRRASPLCHLKRVCQPETAGYKLCRARGAICVPNYELPAMFDCLCPPGSEKRQFGSAGDFNCEPRCSAIKQECLKKQATCRPIDKDQVRCDCAPGMILDAHDQRCYLARYSYAINLQVANKYYEPEWRFHSLIQTMTTSNDTTSGSTNTALANHQEEHLHELVPQFQRVAGHTSGAYAHKAHARSLFIADYNQCNITQLLPKSILEDAYEHETSTFMSYIDQCNEKIHQSARTYSLNSKLSEDLRQSLRQHLRDFTVTTNNSLCFEMPPRATGVGGGANQEASVELTYLNCTVYLQSMEPIEPALIGRVFSNCDKHGADERLCWVKPRLLLRKQQGNLEGMQNSTQMATQQHLNFRQVIACELNKFCGDDAHAVRLDEKTSLCSCKCPPDIEMIDLKELEPHARSLAVPTPTPDSSARHLQQQPADSKYTLVLDAWAPPGGAGAIKEICAPKNHCGANSTYCQFKTGSVCQYDIRTGAKCNCVYPSYEDNEGRCIEVTFSQLDSTLIVIIIMIGVCLIVSIVINLYALARSKRGLFGVSKHYPMSEFTTSGANVTEARRNSRPLNRSTGMPNLAFDPND